MTNCYAITVSCGSIVVAANVDVEAEVDQEGKNPEGELAPVTEKMFMEQLKTNMANNQNFSKSTIVNFQLHHSRHLYLFKDGYIDTCSHIWRPSLQWLCNVVTIFTQTVIKNKA